MESKDGPQLQLVDDIPCEAWLNEIGFSQYTDTFLTNFTTGGKYLSRKRLAQLRLQDFPMMNITNYEHQKLLLKSIRSMLTRPYPKQLSRAESKKVSSRPPISRGPSSQDETPALPRPNLVGIVTAENKGARARAGFASKKRHSFDEQVWAAIHKTRGAAANTSSEAVAKLRDSMPNDNQSKDEAKKPVLRRRSTFDGEPSAEVNKGTVYGNLALQFNMLQKQMESLQEKYLNKLKHSVGCERANILFVNEKTRELMFFTNNRWFRVPMDSGIAGYAVNTGESMHIPDAYADERFNVNIDKSIGVKTRNMLCQAVRAYRGGGHIVGAVELINKTDEFGDPLDFDTNDEDVLASHILTIAEELGGRYNELLTMSDMIAPFATPIMGGRSNSRRPSFAEKRDAIRGDLSTADTVASAMRKAKDLMSNIEEKVTGFTAASDRDKSENETVKFQRRKSYGKLVQQEIEANPDMLYTTATKK